MGVLVVAVAWIAALVALAWWLEYDSERWRHGLLMLRLVRLVRRCAPAGERWTVDLSVIRRGVVDGYAGFMAASGGIPPRYVAVTVIRQPGARCVDVSLRWSFHYPQADELHPGAVVLALGD